MIKHFCLILLLLFSGKVMAEGLFIHSFNNVSNRYAILDELQDTAVLYLSEVDNQKPVKDAFAYMRVEPLDILTWKNRMKRGESPILHIGLASESSVITKTQESDFTFKWSLDGQSVALIYKQLPIAFISIKEKYGFSKSVKKNSPIVNSWNEELYDELFN